MELKTEDFGKIFLVLCLYLIECKHIIIMS